MQSLNPLSGLPGNAAIRQKLLEIISSGRGCAAYIDIVDFKPFNDYYGFALGDSIIRRLSHILIQSIPDSFVGHIGGDDFLCIGYGDKFKEGVETARQRFRSIVPAFYTRRDREMGGIEAFDRHGSYKFFPLLDIAVIFTDASSLPENFTVEALAKKAGKNKKKQKGEQIPLPVYPILEKILKIDYVEADTKALIEACGVLREENAVPILAAILNGDYSSNLRKSAAFALGHIGNKECSLLLCEALHDNNPHVRTRAVEGVVISLGYGCGKIILPLLNDSSTWVRRSVLRGIGQAGWDKGLDYLKQKALSTAPGLGMNTPREREAALEGIAFLGLPIGAEFLAELSVSEKYSSSEAAFSALCSVGTDYAANEVLRRNTTIPDVLSLYGVSSSNLLKLEVLAGNCLLLKDRQIISALRFFEGFPVDFSHTTVSSLKNCLGFLHGEILTRLILLLDSRDISTDYSCVARIANRLDKREEIGVSAVTAFLNWISKHKEVNPGSLLKSFLRSNNRAYSAAAALAIRSMASRDLTQREN